MSEDVVERSKKAVEKAERLQEKVEQMRKEMRNLEAKWGVNSNMTDTNQAPLRAPEAVLKSLSERFGTDDPINHPKHYTAYKGLEIIDLTEQMNFNRGNAVKYIARAGLKDPEKEIEDLDKARWYIEREIERLKKAQ